MTILVTLAGPAQTSVGLGAVGPLLVIMSPKEKRKATPPVCDEDDFALLSSNAVAPSWAPTVARQTSRRPKRMKSDDVELLYSRRNVPAGPTTVRELFQWPATVLEQIATRPGCKDRMLRNIVNGVLNTTDYSGVDCPREICYQLGAAMQKIWNIHPSMRFLRSCDNGVIQQKVLTWISNELDGGKSCVFSELESVLDTATKEVLDAMEPTEEHRSSNDPDVREATVAAYQDIKAVLYQNRKRLFKSTAEAYCIQHQDCRCPLLPADFNDTTKLRLNWSGTTCVGWSAVGHQKGHADASERDHHVWTAQRVALAEEGKEDGFFQECTVRYPVEEHLANSLEDTHRVVWVRWGPELQGIPARRPRLFSFGMARNRLVWVGPQAPEAIQADFAALFGSTTHLDGDAFLLLPEEQVKEWFTKKLNEKFMFGDAATLVGDKALKRILSPMKLQTMEAYSKLREAKGNSNGTFLADLEQSPTATQGTCGWEFPCQLTHGVIKSWRGERIFVGLEHLSAHGWHVLPGAMEDYQSPMAPLFSKMSDHALKKLSGNGMSLQALAAWTVYCLAHCARVESPKLLEEYRLGSQHSKADQRSSPKVAEAERAEMEIEEAIAKELDDSTAEHEMNARGLCENEGGQPNEDEAD